MNAGILIFLLSISGSQAACLPDSAFQKSLSILTMDIKGIEEATATFESAIVHSIPQDHELMIKLEAHNPRINAEIIKIERSIILSVWGGMMGHPLMNHETFLLLLCHEIGHVLGGPPLKSKNGWSSTEGQADYYSGICAKDLGIQQDEFLKAALNLGKIYAQVTNQPGPSLASCDDSSVTRTNYGYPQVQCRLDSIIAGWKGKQRPGCWYFP